MAYYNKIAKQWHSVTGSKGGALKKYLLNNLILSKIQSISGLSILELGAGNGYFIPMMLKRFSGQVPSEIIITDQSNELLKIATHNFHILIAEYLTLDIRKQFPFKNRQFDLIITTMVFNEISKNGLQKALKECNRVLNDQGLMIATTLHPAFINSLQKRNLLKKDKRGFLTMPGAKQMRLPLIQREINEYYFLFRQYGFQFTADEVYPNKKVLNAKPSLQKAGNIPLAIIFQCEKIKDLIINSLGD